MYAIDDWLESEECADIIAQPVEPPVTNPYADDREPDQEGDA